VPTAIEPTLLVDNGWTVNIQKPADPARAGILLLLHGWGGDERVMWIFARKLVGKYWIFAPRGTLSAPEGGYGWLPHVSLENQHLADFAGVTAELLQGIAQWGMQAGVPPETLEQPLNVMGFSQGAALAYAIASLHPKRVGRIAALAGYLPNTSPEIFHNLAGKKIFIAHGSQDEIVPVSYAQKAAALLQNAGAQVTYCESDVGHKLSLACLNGLETFF
jgi:phospholipase/carboxylesterase